MTGDTFESRTEHFLAWIQLKDVYKSPKVTIANHSSSGQGRCVLATEDIKQGEVLCKIPRSALLNIRTCSLARDHQSMANSLADLPDWEGLILALMYEWKVKKESSPWLDYFDVLPLRDPTYTMNQLNFWQPEELKQLYPSLVLDRIGPDNALKLYASLEPLFEKYVGKVTIDEFNLVASVIMSYSFDLDNETEKDSENETETETETETENENEDENENEHGDHEGDDASASEKALSLPFLKTMVPFADTMNAHSRLQNAYVHEEEEFLVIEATKDISPNEQVYNTYSVDSNAELLRMYGYVEERPMDQDVGEISLESIKQHFAKNSSLSREIIEEIFLILKEVESEDDEPFVFETFNCYANGEIDKELTFVIQFLVIVSAIDHKEAFNSAPFAARSRVVRRVYKKVYQLLMGEKITKHLLDHYSSILKERLSEYSEDTAAAPWDRKTDRMVPSRTQMAKMVLHSEQAALKACTCTEKIFDFSVIDDDKLLRNIMKKDVFHRDHPSKKPKLN